MPDIVLDYRPTPKQLMFHRSAADEILYGGAAGGGKSKACVMDALFRCMNNPGTSAYLFRRTYRELEDTLIQEAQKSIPKELGTYSNSKHELLLPNGSKMIFRHCQYEKDRFLYAGSEIQWLYIDELTLFPKIIYDFLKTRVRAKASLRVKPIVRCTSNPGGVGHGWVKQYFVDSAPYFEMHKEVVHSEALNEDQVRTIQYIPAFATDNPHIGKDYIFELEQKPRALRRALLNGDWDAFEGQAFPEFADDPEHYHDGFRTHIIDPIEIPDWWPRWRSMDFGYAKPFSIGWWAIAPDGIMYRYREWYGCEKGQPNKGIYLTPQEIARQILVLEEPERMRGIRFNGVADPSIADASRGQSVEQAMADEGVYWDLGDNKRLPGKMQVHNRLRFRGNGRPMLYAFSTCEAFRRLMPTMVYDENRVEDIDTHSEDHLYDEVRYMCMEKPIAGIEPKQDKKREWNPLEDD